MQLKGYSSRRFLKEFPQKNWTHRGLDYLLSKIDKYGMAERVPGSGCGALHERLITLLQLKNLCKAKRISRRHTIRFVRQHETGIHRCSIHRINRKDLALKCIKKKQAQDLTDANKKARLVHARQLLRRYLDHMVKFIWFSDEKLFSVAVPVNTQNDRLYVPTTSKKRHQCECDSSAKNHVKF